MLLKLRIVFRGLSFYITFQLEVIVPFEHLQNLVFLQQVVSDLHNILIDNATNDPLFIMNKRKNKSYKVV